MLEIVSEDHDEHEPELSKQTLENYDARKEKAFFRDDGEIIVKRTEHRGVGRKESCKLVACNGSLETMSEYALNAMA
jgi:hypothetical protein